MSQPMIPLNYPSTQVEAQVAQFIEGTQPGFYSDENTPAATVARATGAPGSTVEFIGE